MLVINGDDGQTAPVADVAGEWFEVGNHQIDLGVIDEAVQARKTAGGLRDCDQVLSDGALIADSIVHVGEAEAVDLGDFKFVLQVLHASVE